MVVISLLQNAQNATRAKHVVRNNFNLRCQLRVGQANSQYKTSEPRSREATACPAINHAPHSRRSYEARVTIPFENSTDICYTPTWYEVFLVPLMSSTKVSLAYFSEKFILQELEPFFHRGLAAGHARVIKACTIIS